MWWIWGWYSIARQRHYMPTNKSRSLVQHFPWSAPWRQPWRRSHMTQRLLLRQLAPHLLQLQVSTPSTQTSSWLQCLSAVCTFLVIQPLRRCKWRGKPFGRTYDAIWARSQSELKDWRGERPLNIWVLTIKMGTPLSTRYNTVVQYVLFTVLTATMTIVVAVFPKCHSTFVEALQFDNGRL